MFDLVAQAIGIVAMVVAILSFQAKTQRTIILMQLFSTSLFAVHFFLLGAYGGVMLNLICAARSVVYVQIHKPWASHPVWIFVFSALSVASYFITIFALTPQITLPILLLEILPVTANVITTVSQRMKDAKSVRKFNIWASPLWLIYNVVNHSIGATICESFVIISIVVAMLRLDRKRNG